MNRAEPLLPQTDASGEIVRRMPTDSPEGKLAERQCPCLFLRVIFVDEVVVGDQVLGLVCQACGAGYVREQACPNPPKEVVRLFEERGLNGPFGQSR